MSRWHKHPGVRSGEQLSRGERAADKMRNGMGSWAFVFAACGFLAVWMLFNRNSGFDPYPFILLNLVLSCLAAMQGAILLIAAKRSDQISSELAQHDYETDQDAREILKTLRADFAALTASQSEQTAKLDEAVGMLWTLVPKASGGVVDPANAYTVGQDPAPLIVPPQGGEAP